MNIKLILISLMLTVFVGSAFGQTSFSASAKSRSTTGVYLSDPDNISAKDIFDIDRTFFSAGYMPTLTSAYDYAGDGSSANNAGTMNAFWAMPINKSITIGLAGEYKMYAEKTATSSDTTKNAYYTENSAFNLRPVVKWNNFAFHYRISRGSGQATKNNLSTFSGNQITDESSTINRSIAGAWEHEFAVAYNAKKFSIYVPIGFIIDNNSIIAKSTNSTTGNIVNSTTQSTSKDSYVSMYINPEFVMPLKHGAMTHFTVGVNASFDLDREVSNMNTYTNITSGATEIQTAEYKNQGRVAIDVYFNPSLEWKISKGKIDFALEPTIGLQYGYTNTGTYQLTTDGVEGEDYGEPLANYVTPYINVAVGSLIRPIEWFEIRAGISYGLRWQNEIRLMAYDYNLNKDGTYSTSSYLFESIFDVSTGFGFIIGKDIFIDLYIQAGKSVELATGGGMSSSDTTDELFNITAYGIQFLYKF